MTNAISGMCFNLFVSDIQKGIEFYKNVLGVRFNEPFLVEFGEHQQPHCEMTDFPLVTLWSQAGLSISQDIHNPTLPIIYFDCDDCDEILKKAIAHGGKIITPKTPMNNAQYGYCAKITDIDGNVIGLWSEK